MVSAAVADYSLPNCPFYFMFKKRVISTHAFESGTISQGIETDVSFELFSV